MLAELIISSHLNPAAKVMPAMKIYTVLQSKIQSVLLKEKDATTYSTEGIVVTISNVMRGSAEAWARVLVQQKVKFAEWEAKTVAKDSCVTRKQLVSDLTYFNEDSDLYLNSVIREIFAKLLPFLAII